MEIQSLKLLVSEDELNELVRQHQHEMGAVEKLRLRLTPEGVIVQGEYPTFLMKMAFETLWELGVNGPEVQARLAAVRVAGLPAGMLKGALLKMIADVAGKEPGVRLQDDVVSVHLEEAARARGLFLRVCLNAVRCSVGCLVVEAGPSVGS